MPVIVLPVSQTSPVWPTSAAQPADWSSLARARGSLRRDLALEAASGDRAILISTWRLAALRLSCARCALRYVIFGAVAVGSDAPVMPLDLLRIRVGLRVRVRVSNQCILLLLPQACLCREAL